MDFINIFTGPKILMGCVMHGGKRINKNPYFKSLYAATTLYGVSPEIRKYIIAEPELLPKNGLYG